MNNTQTNYGYISIFFHWLAALSIFALFALGYYMVDLTYYHTWYKTAPELHKSVGIVLFALMLIRLIWRYKQVTPEHLASHSTLERKAGKLIHTVLYAMIFIIMSAGYLISTADGRGIEVFELFVIPGFGAFIENQEDLAGLIHKWLAYVLVALALLHALAALKHHFIDKDNTLNRMIGKRQNTNNIR
ncbi:cytochrome b [Colwellia sp. 39_35_sub15_T18]|nr:cytochrome b [Colwellia sp. 39_35_sub15_T18]